MANYILDTNIVLSVYCNDYEDKNKDNLISRFFEIVSSSDSIYIDPISVSELYNLIVRKEHAKFIKKDKANIEGSIAKFKKQNIFSEVRRKIFIFLNEIFRNHELKIRRNNIDVSVDELMNSKLEPNDMYIYNNVSPEYKFITEDKDFKQHENTIIIENK